MLLRNETAVRAFVTIIYMGVYSGVSSSRLQGVNKCLVVGNGFQFRS
jgi:hypothetical protein